MHGRTGQWLILFGGGGGGHSREVKIPRFRCTGTGSMILAIFSSMSVPLLVIKVHIFRIIYHCLLQENRKSMIELQTSVKQDDTTRTRTPKPGYLNLSSISLPDRYFSPRRGGTSQKIFPDIQKISSNFRKHTKNFPDISSFFRNFYVLPE
jgi:hypothetical protein